ncbi:TetR family transcriptional regulator [Trueperella pyogenes]|uniref:TetR/AcrR family transcriptional regulator n=1 Tax=Trueperella pyogenes TaxID=1661 RepID=UPI001859E9B8|nr:TetR family transcriptional regulator [Trueperella pyogenes]MBB3025723.1 AcrR family transcriptional regulator [Trueperella pyogenes]UVJ53708.1 TetR family transcriptional regulator [Trueperella pyogenes]UVJ55692.1 TetR family transcriptional regulator [Trueperella pyogenes]UVJ57753.1 TetR family transcriptional regulator [Trueperella pyogenes]
MKEHHSMMYVRLVDAAEVILREDGPAALTAAAVATSAGMARNSIYRYVESIDDLRLLVLERYIPGWQKRIDAALAAESDPYLQLQILVEISLDIGAEAGHQWLIDVVKAGLGRGKKGEKAPSGAEIQSRSEEVLNFHRELAHRIVTLWREITPRAVVVNSQMTRSILDAGLKLLDQGYNLHEVKETSLRMLATLAGR